MVLTWEEVQSRSKTDKDVYPDRLSRARVPGGWLIYMWGGGRVAGITFYPDPQHQWDGSSLDETS